jgi:hypothetical protein
MGARKERAPERTGWDESEAPPGLSRTSCGAYTPARNVTEQAGAEWSISIKRFGFIAAVLETIAQPQESAATAGHFGSSVRVFKSAGFFRVQQGAAGTAWKPATNKINDLDESDIPAGLCGHEGKHKANM